MRRARAGRVPWRSYDAAVRLRLYHHPDGARVAYREIGAGPPLALLHSALLSHKEWEPAVEQLADRFRVVLPDLPLHGDSEDRPRHPYTLDWFAEVIGGFAAEVLGPRPLLAGHDAGAEILLHAVASRPRAPGAARADAQPPARAARRAPRRGARLAAGHARGRRPGARRPALLRRARRVHARARPAPVRAREPRRAPT